MLTKTRLIIELPSYLIINTNIIKYKSYILRYSYNLILNMQNKRTLMKVGAGAVVATAIAGTIIAIQSGDDDFNGIMSA